MTLVLSRVLVFKTNIQTECDKLRVQSALDAFDRIHQWNIDMDDIDCVLRIVSDSLTPEQIISVIQQYGFECMELN